MFASVASGSTSPAASSGSGGRVPATVAEAIVRGASTRGRQQDQQGGSAYPPGMAWGAAPGSRPSTRSACRPREPGLRQVALRWLEPAPKADATWEYYASRQPSKRWWPHGGRRTFELEEIRANTPWDETRRLVDVRLWHPMFPEVPEDVRMQAAFLFLDNLLGEDDVERWIGVIDLFEARPAGGPRTSSGPRSNGMLGSRRRRTWVLGEVTRPDGTRDRHRQCRAEADRPSLPRLVGLGPDALGRRPLSDRRGGGAAERQEGPSSSSAWATARSSPPASPCRAAGRGTS